jgi:dienelactone hydrolase
VADTLPKPDPQAFDNFLRAAAQALHAKDEPPVQRKEWEARRGALRSAMFAAMGPFPDQPCPLEPKELGVLKRDGYRIEKLIFQSRPDVWVTASAYVPEGAKGKAPAVLVVHGHWAGARRDPVVQARCLGLVKLGFFVLAVDAFGAGERFTRPALGTYHGALYGSTLWPVGQTLLGMQVYDNRRAVDYLLTRPEVDGERLGITGASGGGNQTMYAGALDERFRAVVPVCSVGTYQAYLRAACCVCEVLPGALRFCEEGDVLALVAPRALLVINATKDAFQFSVGEAEKSVARARPIFRLYNVEKQLQHATFESPHAYNQAMRETMYGWMTRWLKEEGDGQPIPEPKHDVEKPEDLACFPDENRPKGFLFPPSFAAREAAGLLAKFRERKPDHAEDWVSTAVHMRSVLRKQVFGDFPTPPRSSAQLGAAATADGVLTTPLVLQCEPELPLHAVLKQKTATEGKTPACVLLHLDGKAKALEHPLAAGLVQKGWLVLAPDLRATGEMKPPGDGVHDATDHNSTEHALWVGRPLLGQWVFDVLVLLDWLGLQAGLDRRRFAVAGLGQAGVVALCAAGLFDDRVSVAAAVDAPLSYVTEEAYGPGTRMGLLAPGILRVGDIPQLAALSAPRRLILAGGVTPQGQKRTEKQLREAYAFTSLIYKLHKAEDQLSLAEEVQVKDF